MFPFSKYKRSSRLQHHGSIAAAGLYPAVDKEEKGWGSGAKGGAGKELKNDLEGSTDAARSLRWLRKK